MAVNADKTGILVLYAHSEKARMLRSCVLPDDTRIFALTDLIFGRLKDAQLIDYQGKLWKIKAARIRGITSYWELGAPFFTYLLVLAFGIVLLTLPVNVELSMERVGDLELSEVKQYVQGLLEKNPDAYTHDAPHRMKRKIAIANSVGTIANALMGS